jgi:RNA polymerase sigma-70 factor (ECF subfamily)
MADGDHTLEQPGRPQDWSAEQFERLVEAELGFLQALGRCHLGSEDEVVDLVQETILKAWQHRRTLQNPGSFKSWLGSILIRNCHMAQRKMSVERSYVRRQEQVVGRASASAAGECQEESQAELLQALRTLEGEDQMILALKYAEGRTYSQIARQLQLSESAVRGRLARAREEIRRKLRKPGS